MSAQTRYGFSTPSGVAGGIVDLAPYAIDTFLVENDTGAMKFGLGVVKSDEKAGSAVRVPKSGDTADKFEGITVNGRTTEYDLEGRINIRKGASIGVMRYGRIYGRVDAEAEPAYGDPVYLIVDDAGGKAGLFTKDEGSNVAVNGRFLSAKDDSTGVAVIELFNAPAPTVSP